MEMVEGRNLLEHVTRASWLLGDTSSGGGSASAEDEITRSMIRFRQTVPRADPMPAPLKSRRCVTPARLDRLIPAFRDLVRGIGALHRLGCIHRDLKPSNVLVSEAGRVVILDFGLLVDVGAAPLNTFEIAEYSAIHVAGAGGWPAPGLVDRLV